MNKLIIVAKNLVMVTFLSILAVSQAFSHTSKRSEKSFEPSIPNFSEQDIKERLSNLSSVIDINYTYEVGRRIREYTVAHRKSGEQILGRVDLFFPLFEKEIHARKLPDELKYVAVVESNLKPSATSHIGAAGLWQFISSTGRMKGLTINSLVDERRDPVKSTQAALDYLNDLYCEFDDWTLAIAAYNCGPGGVRRAIQRGASYNYWDIRKYLPQETQKYVPRIIAAMYLMQYYHVHNMTPEMVDKDLKYTASISDGKKHNFYTLSKELDVPYQTLKSLNPQFKSGYIPNNNGNYTLVIPRSKYEDYLKLHDNEAYQDMVEKKRQERIQRLSEIKTMMEKEKVEPLLQLEAIPTRKVFSQVVMRERIEADKI